MLVHAILLDSAMPVSAVLSRLARHGIWLDPKQPDAAEWITQQAELMELPFDEVASLLKEPNPGHYGAAIRRQWVANVLWYARPILHVLDACSHANRDTRLIDAMGLHEYDSRPTQGLNRAGNYAGDSVVVQNNRPVAVNLQQADAAPAFQQLNRQMPTPSVDFGGAAMRSGATPQAAPGEPRATTVSVWPKMDAPTYARARVPFDVTVGFSLSQQQGVAGGQVHLTAAAGEEKIDVSVQLLAEGFDPPEGGWSRLLPVPVADPASVSVSFRLVAKPPDGHEPVRLTTLEVRFVIGGKVCGTASRPIIIGPETGDQLKTPDDKGTPWLGEAPTVTPMDMAPDPDAADLTIELAKPDRNPTTGDFVCRVYSRHQLSTPLGPWDVHLGQDVKTFAQQLIKTVRQSSKVLVTKYLRSVGSLVTQTLPPEVFDAITEVAAKTAPKPPAVLFLSDEPFVPWELALLQTPVDKTRPPFLGAQTIFGRWFREPSTSRQARIQRPQANPPSGIGVKHMAAIAGNYTPKSGLAALPGAEAEVKKLKASLNAVPMRATPEAVLQVLEARLEREMDLLGPAGAVHYAGHGQFDATDPDSSVLFLSDGTALSSLLFRDAEYGGEHQPIIFFNACMIGLGGEVLGDMGGFPGNCLRGGFGAVLGALWEVDDAVAGDIALEFWERTLPASGPGEPVAEVLRDLRGKYTPQQPVPTYLAYTYWGHPRLRLQRLN